MKARSVGGLISPQPRGSVPLQVTVPGRGCLPGPQASGDAGPRLSSQPPGVLLCSGTWLVSGSNTRRLRLWAVGAAAGAAAQGLRGQVSMRAVSGAGACWLGLPPRCLPVQGRAVG